MNLTNLVSLQEWLNDAWIWIKDFFNQPVPIIGVSVGFALLFVLKIISNTSIGKKALNEFRRKTATLEKNIVDYYNNDENFKKSVDETVAKQKEWYEAELLKAQAKNKELQDLLIEMASNLHNKKIKEIVNDYLTKNNEETTNDGE